MPRPKEKKGTGEETGRRIEGLLWSGRGETVMVEERLVRGGEKSIVGLVTARARRNFTRGVHAVEYQLSRPGIDGDWWTVFFLETLKM